VGQVRRASIRYCSKCIDRILSRYGDIHAPKFNSYDITKKCVIETASPYNDSQNLCYDFTDLERFMNRPEVKKALGVDTKKDWVICNEDVWRNLMRDMDTDATIELAGGNKNLFAKN
jgi:hypothetical protein